MTKSRDEKNTVQAKHHQLIGKEAMERALAEGRDIGFNDVAYAIASKMSDPGAAAILTHALKYQTRMGRKDDERQEVEKAIWYLMDLHNRFSDKMGEPRQYAPWRVTGKITENAYSQLDYKEYTVEKDMYFTLNKEVLNPGDEICFCYVDYTSPVVADEWYKLELDNGGELGIVLPSGIFLYKFSKGLYGDLKVKTKREDIK